MHCVIFAGKTVLLVEKAKRLAEKGEKVVFIIARHDYNTAKGSSMKVAEKEHFLHQHLKRELSGYENITFQYESVLKVLDKAKQFMNSGYHVFIDEFTYEAKQNLNFRKSAKKFRVPQVSVSLDVNPFEDTFISGLDHICMDCWQRSCPH